MREFAAGSITIEAVIGPKWGRMFARTYKNVATSIPLVEFFYFFSQQGEKSTKSSRCSGDTGWK
jgi:hypothetical protein